LSWYLSRSGKAKIVENLLWSKRLLPATTPWVGSLRHSCCGQDNGLFFNYTKLIRSYGLRQEFITPHFLKQNNMMERVIQTLKESCVHKYSFESLQNARRVNCRLDCFLQQPTPASGAVNENTRQGICCFSGVS